MLRSLALALLCASTLLAQEPEPPEPPAPPAPPEHAPFERGDDVFALLERDGKFVDVQWRRTPAGEFEWALAGIRNAAFARLYEEHLPGLLRATGLAGLSVLFHHDDVMSLTAGEPHLRRLGIATDTAALAAFVRATPPNGEPAREQQLDRFVAVDVLRTRRDDAAKTALAALAGDEAVSAAIRARAAAPPQPSHRERLTAQDLLLPERADLVVVVDHRHVFDAHVLLDHLRWVGLTSTGQVLERLKRPRIGDAGIGQAESEAQPMVPYELVRHLGNARFDHTCACVSWTEDVGGALVWAGVAVGACEPERLANGLAHGPLEQFVATSAGEAVRATWTSGAATARPTRVTAHAAGVDVAVRDALAAHLLRDGDYSVRVYLPAGSKLLARLAEFRFPGVITPDVPIAYDLDVLLGDPVVFRETFTMADADAAARVGGEAFPLFERVLRGVHPLLQANGAEPPGSPPPKVTVADTIVRSTRELPRGLFPDLATLRPWRMDVVRYR